MIQIIIIAILLVVLITVITIITHKANKAAPPTPEVKIADDCCGAHAVCERDSLLSKTDQIIYFDDEELDELKGISPEEFTDKQNQMLEDVFFTLREQDMAGWIRSLQLRNIELPDDLREQALLIISERRQNTLDNYNKNHQ